MSWTVVMPHRRHSSAPTKVRARTSSLLRSAPMGQGVEQPYFQWQLLEQPATQHIMRMIMRIDESGHDQSSRGIDDFVHVVGCKIGADRKDLVVFDQNIGDRRLMDIAFMVVDLA